MEAIPIVMMIFMMTWMTYIRMREDTMVKAIIAVVADVISITDIKTAMADVIHIITGGKTVVAIHITTEKESVTVNARGVIVAVIIQESAGSWHGY